MTVEEVKQEKPAAPCPSDPINAVDEDEEFSKLWTLHLGRKSKVLLWDDTMYEDCNRYECEQADRMHEEGTVRNDFGDLSLAQIISNHFLCG